MSGRLTVVGTGPGNPEQTTPEAIRAIAEASRFYGYGPYLDRLVLRPDQERVASDNREELSRAKAALKAAAAGQNVCVVSGGDPGVFAMAAAICEAIEDGPPAWRALDVEMVPGVTAMLAVAARAGAPLGHDFCAINLSDNLKPASLVEARVRAAAGAGFAMAFYNPRSASRPDTFARVLGVLRETCEPARLVTFARAVSTPDEQIRTVSLAEAMPDMADMRTVVIVGNAATRRVGRFVYTPRSAA